ncbi:hypothetical protein JKA74_00355 [Marivirga sp. S37H4]|uniref:Uncharacterized protein n=1 Tax=Marivirga aurantiaca TaxID=2802615 RepID=A0A934WV21_9BACT|nr:hypothetical protein [Marivirga aurantiaca]MBK6263467.1 hypothetical protein [Marivirga aurantiaca]
MRNIILIFSLIVVIGCNKKVASGNSSSGYREVAYEALDIPQMQFTENISKDYVLGTFQNRADVPGSEPLKYIVIKIADNSVIKKGSIPNGSVKWADDYQLEIVAPPGMPEGNDKTIADYTYRFDVKSGKKIQQATISN